jgi:TP901 family phage tail tape measure protein
MAEKKLMLVIGAKASEYEKTMQKIRKDGKDLSKGLKAISQDMKTAGKTLTASITVPAMAVGGIAIKSFGDFEKALAGSFAIMGNLSDDMKTKLSGVAREVATTTRFSATEAAESYYYLASAGLSAAQSIEALPKVAAFAQAGNFDMARATDLLTDAQSALGLSVDDTAKNIENMVRVSDVLTQAQVLANATTEQFAESLTSKAGNALRTVGKDIEEGTAALAVFADQGIKGEQAGTLLTNTLFGLSDRAKESAEDFKRLNVKVFESDGSMRNLADIAEDLEAALSGMSTEQKLAELSNMGFTKEARQGILALMGNSEALRDYETSLRSAGGVTKEVANNQINNMWDQLGLLKDKAIDAAIGLGSVLVPIIRDSVFPVFESMISWVGQAVKWFGDLSPAFQQIIIGGAALAVAFGPIIWGMGSMIGAINNIIPIAIKMSGALKGVVVAIKGKVAAIGVLKAAMAAMSGPVGWITLAVVAIAGIGYAWYRASTESERAIAQMTDKSNAQFMRMTADVREQLTQKYEAIIEKYTAIKDDSLAIFQELADGQIEITSKNKDDILTQAEEQKERKLELLDQQMQEELALIERGLADGLIASEEAAEKMRQAVLIDYENRAGVVQSGFERIQEIIKGAFGEERELTEEELEEIETSYEEMYESIIAKLKSHVVEYKGIEALKNLDVNEMSKEQLAEYRRLVDEEHEKMKDDLKANIEESLLTLKQLYDNERLSYEEYIQIRSGLSEKLIDGNIEIMASEKEMVDGIIKEHDRLRSEWLTLTVGMTQEQADRWNWLYNKLVGNSIVPDMVTDVIAEFKRWEGLSTILKDLGIKMIGSLLDGLRTKFNDLKSFLSDVSLSIKKAFDPNQRHSPSLVDLINIGVADINRAFEKIDLPEFSVRDIADPAMAMAGGYGGAMSSNESTTHIPITAHYYVNSKETAEHANNDLIRRIQLRGGGRF